MKQKKDSTASIVEHSYCADCGWPLIHACCNDEFDDFANKKGECADYWLYCSNKGCKNHEGEGFLQKWPEWAKDVDE